MKSLKQIIKESMSTEIQSLHFDSDYEERKFIYRYTSNGVRKEVTVSLIESDDESYRFQVNEGVVNIDRSILDVCPDPDNCGVVIAKQVIKDNDGEVDMSLVDECGENLIDHLILTKENDFIPITEDDLTWTFSLYANSGMSTLQFEICGFDDEDDYESVLSMIESEDEDELSDFLIENGSDRYELICLVGDDDTEKLSYEVNDINGNDVDSGTLPVYERNVYKYPIYGCVKLEKDPEKYLLVQRDEIKRSYSEFEVPKDFNVNNIRFIESAPFYPIGEYNLFGDTVTNMNSFVYNGKFYASEIDSDCGTWGDIHYSLYKWNKDRGYYEFVVGF